MRHGRRESTISPSQTRRTDLDPARRSGALTKRPDFHECRAGFDLRPGRHEPQIHFFLRTSAGFLQDLSPSAAGRSTRCRDRSTRAGSRGGFSYGQVRRRGDRAAVGRLRRPSRAGRRPQDVCLPVALYARVRRVGKNEGNHSGHLLLCPDQRREFNLAIICIRLAASIPVAHPELRARPLTPCRAPP